MTKLTSLALTAVATVLAGGIAIPWAGAQPMVADGGNGSSPLAAAPTTTSQASPASPSSQPSPANSARAPAEDPQADRVVLLPTAYTHPEGTVFFSNYELVVFQLGYAFTDNTQISFSAVPPLGDERIAFLDLTLKTALVRDGLVRVAALGSMTGGAGNDIGILFVGRVGGVAQFCFAPTCESSFTLSSNVALAGPVLLMINGVGAIVRAGRRVSLLAELVTAVPIGRENNELNGAAVASGVRFHFIRWGFDLTLVRAFQDPTVLPFLTLTYRSLP